MPWPTLVPTVSCLFFKVQLVCLLCESFLLSQGARPSPAMLAGWTQFLWCKGIIGMRDFSLARLWILRRDGVSLRNLNILLTGVDLTRCRWPVSVGWVEGVCLSGTLQWARPWLRGSLACDSRLSPGHSCTSGWFSEYWPLFTEWWWLKRKGRWPGWAAHCVSVSLYITQEIWLVCKDFLAPRLQVSVSEDM